MEHHRLSKLIKQSTASKIVTKEWIEVNHQVVDILPNKKK